VRTTRSYRQRRAVASDFLSPTRGATAHRRHPRPSVWGHRNAKANAEKNLQNARALFDSHVQSIFVRRGNGWAEKPLAELCDIKHGFAFKSEFFASSGDHVLLTPGNFHEAGGYRERGEKSEVLLRGDSGRVRIVRGDLLLAMTEQAAGLLGSPSLSQSLASFFTTSASVLSGRNLMFPGRTSSLPRLQHRCNSQGDSRQFFRVKVRHTSPTKIGNVMVAFPHPWPSSSAVRCATP